MKPQEIDKLKMLDPNGCYGSLQQILMDPNINQIGYAEALYHVLAKCIDEKAYLERVNNAMTRVMVAKGMHGELNKCLELEEK